MKILFVLNDPPYGTERAYNALRLALLKQEAQAGVTVFLMADAVTAAKAGQKTPDGYYNIERMLTRVLARNGTILLCGTCTKKAPSWRVHAAARWMNLRPQPLKPTKVLVF
jgi:uncharacterized protein involved in oxidation of intracellular sulfur